MKPKNKPLHQFELSKLQNSTDEVVKDHSLRDGFKDGGKFGTTEHIDTMTALPQPKATDWTEKIAKLRALKQAGKKVMGMIPLAGAGYAALNGEPAMAAEELAGDVPVVGQAYEALRPEAAGQSSGDERQMLAEIQAQKNYQDSPAHLARLEALKKFGR